MNNIEASNEDILVLNSKVEVATEELSKIKSKDEIIKDYKKEFTEHLLNALRTQFPQENLEREEKVIKGLFNKIVTAQVKTDTTNDENMLVAGFLRKKVEEMVMLIYAYRYLKLNDINKLFDSYGIKLDYKPIEEHLTYLEGTNFKDTLKEFIDNSVKLKIDVEDIKENIDEGIYNELPATLKYNKDLNPSGIKKNVFKKFSLLNLLKKINLFKAKKKYEDMVNESNNRTKADTIAISVADNIVSENKTSNI